MRKRSFFTTVAAVATVLLLAATIATPSLAAPLSGMPADIPAIGDTWQYNLEAPFTTGNATLTVAGVVDINAGENELVPYHCYNYTTNYTTETPVIDTSVILRTYYSTDGNVTAIFIHRVDNYKLAGYYFETHGTYYFNDTWKMFDFPLSEGKTWSKGLKVWFIGYIYNSSSGSGFNYTWTTPLSYDITVTGVVVNVTSVTTAKGVFECWLVNETSVFLTGYYSLMWYNPDVKNVVYRKDYTNAGVLYLSWNMTDYSVSYPIHELIMMLTMFTLFNTYQQQQQANLRIMMGAGAAVIILVVAGVALYLRRR
ncbi:MAG: hypothetical protein QW261_04925 [Candidatus Jordarchaeaceae archaeon]